MWLVHLCVVALDVTSHRRLHQRVLPLLSKHKSHKTSPTISPSPPRDPRSGHLPKIGTTPATTNRKSKRPTVVIDYYTSQGQHIRQHWLAQWCLLSQMRSLSPPVSWPHASISQLSSTEHAHVPEHILSISVAFYLFYACLKCILICRLCLLISIWVNRRKEQDKSFTVSARKVGNQDCDTIIHLMPSESLTNLSINICYNYLLSNN